MGYHLDKNNLVPVNEIGCNCTPCGCTLYDNDFLLQHVMFDKTDGELDSIELVHENCGLKHNEELNRTIWS